MGQFAKTFEGIIAIDLTGCFIDHKMGLICMLGNGSL